VESVAERVLVDTSAWIAFFRGASPGSAAVRALLTTDSALRCGPVALELLRGLRRHEANTVLSVWYALPEVPVEAIDFRSAGDLLRELAESGTTLPSLDGLIAATAIRHEVPILALDRHFDLIPGLRRWEVRIRSP
jgi:predicted nucleic acid-binding protein